MPGTTDTRKAQIPTGSFIMNYQSSRMYPQLEPLARKYSADKKDMANSQNVILTNGEIYFPPDAVEAIGVEKLEYMNNKSKGGAHDAIDNAMAMNLLKNIKPMYGGGMVNPSMKPMGKGGMVDAYAGGGMVMNQYGHGGMVKNKMMGYGHGGMVKNKMMNYGHGGMVKDKMMMMEKGGQLKPVPKDNPGLGKLPEMVRNRMGYMQDGGAVQDNTMSDLMNLLTLKEIVDKSPQLSMYDADTRGGVVGQDDLLGISEGNFIPVAGVLNKGVSKLLKQSELAGKAKERYIDLQKQILRDSGLLGKSGIQKLKKEMDEELMPLIETRYRNPSGVIPTKNLPNFNKGGMVDDSLMGMMGGGMAMKKKMMGMQDGGLTGYQDGDLIGPPPPPQMFADEKNRQLEQSIDQRMANPSIYEGSALGAIRDTAMMLQDSIKQDIENKAVKTLKLMGLLNNPEVIESQRPPMPNNQMADSMRVRDLRNLIGLEVMRRGVPAVMQGIGPDFNEILK